MALLRALAGRLSAPQASLAEHCLRHTPVGVRSVSETATGEVQRGTQDIHDTAADKHKSSDTADFIKNAATAPFHEAVRSAQILTGHKKGFSNDNMQPAGNITQARHTDHDKGELYADTLKKAKGKWQDRTAVEAYKHAYAAPEAATATSASAGAKHEDPENKKL